MQPEGRAFLAIEITRKDSQQRSIRRHALPVTENNRETSLAENVVHMLGH